MPATQHAAGPDQPPAIAAVAILLIALASSMTAVGPCRAKPVLLEGIAVQVGDELILESEILEQLAVARMQFALADSNLAAAREEIVKRMIDEKIVVQEARKQGIKAGNDEIERAVQQYAEGIKQNLGSEESLQRELDKEGITYDELLDRYRESAQQEILYSRLVQREIYSKIEVTDEEIEAYFKEHREAMPEKVPQVRLSHVFVGVRPADASIASAQAKLDAVRRRLDAGEEFGAIAREVSDDPGTRELGGDLGWFERGQLDTAFEAIAFGLAVGEVSEPFQTQVGIELVRVTDKDVEHDRVRAQHILILLRVTESDVTRSREKAEHVLELAKSGVDLASLAEQYSDDKDSAARGGDLGEFKLPDLVPFVAAAIKDLAVGELTGVVQGDQGFHIFKVTEREAGGRYTLAEVHDKLRERIVEERAATLTQEWLDRVRGDYFIQRVDTPPPALQRPAPPPPAASRTGR